MSTATVTAPSRSSSATATPKTEICIRPQAGKQEMFLSCNADICFYGGAAGGGKTHGLLLEPIYHYKKPDFGAVLFRRTYPEIANKGGMWDESVKIYPYLGGKPNEGDCEWIFKLPQGQHTSI